MIDRYCMPKIGRIFSLSNKLDIWLEVENAIIRAEVELGNFPEEALQIESLGKIALEQHMELRDDLYQTLDMAAKSRTICPDLVEMMMGKIDDMLYTEGVRQVEKETRHDMAAFIKVVQASLPEHLRKYVHAIITSYDVEEPAMSLMIGEALGIIYLELDNLLDSLISQAKRYKELAMMERTHGQFAEPITLGLRILGWFESLQRQQKKIKIVAEDMRYSKISGAVGTYSGGLSLELERRALEILNLKPAKFSSQIIPRDRHADVINTLAVLAGLLENIALNFRISGRSEVGEIREPFKEGQKGSSAMPHKRNTVVSERLCGLARFVRALPAIALGNIATWEGRDISHSCLERIALPDGFHAISFMLGEAKKLVDGMVVSEEAIKKNLEITNYTFFSPEVKGMLLEHFDPETAYRVAQQAAFKASQRKRTSEETLPEDVYLNELLKMPEIRDSALVPSDFRKVFDMRSKLKNIDKIFARFGI